MELFRFSIAVNSVSVTTNSGQVTKNTADAAYTNTIKLRANKIPIGLPTIFSSKAQPAREILAAHYRNLNTLQTFRAGETEKKQLASHNALADRKEKFNHHEATASISTRHTKNIEELTTDRVDTISVV